MRNTRNFFVLLGGILKNILSSGAALIRCADMKLMNETSTPVSLDDLVVGETELDDSELAKALHGRIGLLREQHNVRLLGSFVSAPAKKRIVAAGLARHAMRRKGWVDEQGLAATAEWF